MNNAIYPEVVKQMIKHKESQADISKLIGLKLREQTSRRLSGKVDWKVEEAKILCKHYNIEFEKLFKRKEE